MSDQSTRHKTRDILRAARMVVPLTAVFIGLLLTLLSAIMVMIADDNHLAWKVLLNISVIGVIIAFLITGYMLKKQLLQPLANLQHAVGQVWQGEPGATVLLDNVGVLDQMVHDIDSISEELTDLYEDMDNRVARQTTRLAQKTASLKILYDVAATINQAHDLDELLIRFLRILKEMVNGRAATVRLVMPDGNMRLVGTIGLDNDVLSEHELLPVHLCMCGTALTPGDILCENNPQRCSRINGRRMFGSDEIDVVTVSLEHHDAVLGIYNIFVDKPGVSGREDIMELLTTIGSHLGFAIAKQRSDEDARLLSIMEERTGLAHELHDSLAQTLAGLRFQVRMLSDTLNQTDATTAAHADLERIRNGLDEAHTELRALLASFRAPIDSRGLFPALEKLAQRFNSETDMHLFLQTNRRNIKLNVSEEMQIMRIVQESLANIRKHANAHTVRVLLNCRNDEIELLIEDDGVGFEQAPSGRPGEHIGLSIMKERAQRMGGNLRIESEPGEGTRIEMTYRPQTVLNAGVES